jgi:hypothetical protein
VDSATTNTILRETKFFQTLTKRMEDIMNITGSNKAIIGSGRATFTLPMGTTPSITVYRAPFHFHAISLAAQD